MENIKIVEYEHKYAEEVSELWNKSGECWGGSNTITTPELVKEQQEGYSNLNTYLAFYENKIVGYCSFSVYAEDEGALYIPLLNVRPDYQGKGIGKALVLKAIERSIELEWPRLDLYTWPGNVKAVPLYKKCGFFWEKRDDSTHLINMIPSVLRTEAVEDYFKKFDWYKDSKRIIKIEPDGIEENKYHYFEYIWEKDDLHLRMQYERRGRGLRLIETEDYIIKATVENLDLVFGKEYEIKYAVVNKSGKPLKISIVGENNKNIRYKHEEEVEVRNETIITGNFFVDKIIEEQSEWKTHPTVSSKIHINGKRADFKVAVLPKYPAKINISVPDYISKINQNSSLFVEVKNNFNIDAKFEFSLPNNEFVQFKNNKLNINLKAKQRQTIEVEYFLKKFGFYKEKIQVNAKDISNKYFKFEKEVTAILKGYNSKIGGETENYWFISNEAYMLRLDKFRNEITFRGEVKDEYRVFLMYPKLGKPYSVEFSKTRPYKVEFIKDGNSIIMNARYKSDDYKGIELNAVSVLYANGILKHYYEIFNTNQIKSRELWLNDSLFFDMYRTVMPYNNEFIEINDSYFSELGFWDSNLVTENWLFSKTQSVTKGIAWGNNSNLVFDNWHLRFDNEIGILNPNQKKETDALYWSIGSFNNWREFRKFVLGKDNNDELTVRKPIDFIVNNNNPFIDKNFTAKVKQLILGNMEGEFSAKSNKNNINKVKKVKKEDVKGNYIDFYLQLKENEKIDTLCFKSDTDVMEFESKKTVFIKNENKIQSSIIKENNMEIFQVDNGVINIKASAEFYNTIFSMIYNNNEWLDSSFPHLIPKSWFNPWAGGIDIRLEKILPASVAREERKVEFAQLKDCYNNNWEGLKTSLIIDKNDNYKGLTINQYFMMLPGVPILCYLAEFVQQTGKMLCDIQAQNFTYLKTSNELKNGYFKVKNIDGSTVKYKCGRVEQQISTTTYVQYGSIEREDKINIITDTENQYHSTFVNNEITGNIIVSRLNANNDSKVFTKPVFYIFSKEVLDYQSLNDLLALSF